MSVSEEHERKRGYILFQVNILRSQWSSSKGPLLQVDTRINAKLPKPNLNEVRDYLDELEELGEFVILERKEAFEGGWKI